METSYTLAPADLYGPPEAPAHWALGDPWMKDLHGVYTLSGGRVTGKTAARFDGRLELLAELIRGSFAIIREPLLLTVLDADSHRRKALVTNQPGYFNALGLLREVSRRTGELYGISRQGEIEAVTQERAALKAQVLRDWRRLPWEEFRKAYGVGGPNAYGDARALVHLASRPRRRSNQSEKGESHEE